MKLNRITLSFGFAAACVFAMMQGCNSAVESDGTSATATDGHDDHDHEGHDHDDHEGHDHDDHAGHDHDAEGHSHDFETLGAAANEIEALTVEIGKHLASGDADAAHDPLHHIGNVLIATEEMVKKMDDSEKKTELTGAVKTLLDSFTEVDSQLHTTESDDAKQEAASTKFGELQPSIDDAIATLKKGA